MNAVNYSIGYIMNNINQVVLSTIFPKHKYPYSSIESLLLNKIIRPRVLVDLNIVGGVHTVIDVNQCSVALSTTSTSTEYIITVPKELTGNRSIISVLSLIPNITFSMTNGYMNNLQQNPLETALGTMVGNLSGSNVIQTSRLEIIGENTVLIQDPAVPPHNGALRCYVENNSNLENINIRSYPAIAQFMLLAVKSKIYVDGRVNIDQGAIYGGHDLGVIKDIIDSYSDAEQMYMESMTSVMRKISFINNSDGMSRHISMMLGNAH